jgi:1,2-diacylglycerol 3-beta-glucosyltransferase
MDADGRMTPNALDAVAPAFDEPSVGGVQLVVRIRNRDSLKLRFQDMEFWAMSGVGQIGRMATGTVSMGGNGQFTRLFALDEIGTNPWSDSLTEDLDLGISLSVLGWTTTSTSGAYVTQQGVDDLRRLIKQRTRWYQGHMLASKRFGELLRSPFLRNIGFFELGAYLAVPWGITLPWSIIQQYLLVQILTGQGLPNHVLESGPIAGRVGYAVVWYLASFAPHLFWGWLYWRRAEDVNMGRALLMCHLMVPWSYVSYAAAWRAFYRIVTGQHGWTKTARSAEDAPQPLGNPPPDGTAAANHIAR